MRNLIKFGLSVSLLHHRGTIRRSQRKGIPVPPVHAISEIPARIHWGREWIKDPRLIDKWYHPTYTQKRIEDSKFGVGDCDDGALYWAYLLSRDLGIDKVWIGVLRYDKANGKKSGHAVVLYEDDLGTRWWADYGMPEQVGNVAEPGGKWQWARQVLARGYGVKLLSAGLYSFALRGGDHIELSVVDAAKF
jgi:hypothetical protein